MKNPGIIVFSSLLIVLASLIVLRGVNQQQRLSTATIPSNVSIQKVFDAGRRVISGLAVVTDGDTIKIDGERIRLFGIDAPEQAQLCELNGVASDCGNLASTKLEGMLSGKEVSCTKRGSDRYGRTIAICMIGGKDIGQQMVAAGWAVAFVKYSSQYLVDEATARKFKIGLWAGSFERPDEWRAARR